MYSVCIEPPCVVHRLETVLFAVQLQLRCVPLVCRISLQWSGHTKAHSFVGRANLVILHLLLKKHVTIEKANKVMFPTAYDALN